MAKEQSLSNIIFFPTALSILAVFIVLGCIAYFYVQSIVSEVFQTQYKSNGSIFVDSIQQDILSGARSEVFRKCKLFHNNSFVTMVKIGALA